MMLTKKEAWCRMFILAGTLTGCAPSKPSDVVEQTYEVTCPVNMTAVVVDTLKGVSYFHGEALSIYQARTIIPDRTYPANCVVKVLIH